MEYLNFPIKNIVSGSLRDSDQDVYEFLVEPGSQPYTVHLLRGSLDKWGGGNYPALARTG